MARVLPLTHSQVDSTLTLTTHVGYSGLANAVCKPGFVAVLVGFEGLNRKESLSSGGGNSKL